MKVKIREMEISDTDFVLEIENNEDIWKVSHTITPFIKSEIELFITKNTIEGIVDGQKRWIIETNKSACGCIDLFDFDSTNSRAGVGIVIHKDFQNKGIATAALKKFLPICKNKLSLNQLYCSIIPENTNSIRLFTNSGFTESGIRKEWTKYKEQWFDEIFYQKKL